MPIQPDTYVIGAQGMPLVKIGKSFNPNHRMHTFQEGSPIPLEMLRIIPFDCERQMHAKYAHLRRHREWFTFDPAMLTDEFVKNEPVLREAA